MAGFEITRGKVQRAQKVVVYGPEGIGKSTLAAAFPRPVFIDTEGGTSHMDVERLPRPSSWAMLIELVKHVRDNPALCETLVIDTADWAEQLCMTELCARNNKTGIEDFGYGKGYIYLVEDFGRLLNLLDEVVARGIHVVFTAHAAMRKIEQPEEAGAYDRWEMKLQKKTAPLLKEWADMVLLAGYKILVVNVDGQGAQKGKNKAQGGARVLRATHHPCWDAKNRHGLPDEMPLDYASIAHCFPVLTLPVQVQDGGRTLCAPTTSADAQIAPVGAIIDRPSYTEPPTPSAIQEQPPDDIPPALRELMQANNVSVEDIQFVVSEKGYYPRDTPISNYDPAFVSGVLIGAWSQVLAMITKTPF
ncbi:MAG: ATP-binding protein [Clostridia bacterium]|nr:ATP-binding protein [Clostridia bacterium]